MRGRHVSWAAEASRLKASWKAPGVCFPFVLSSLCCFRNQKKLIHTIKTKSRRPQSATAERIHASSRPAFSSRLQLPGTSRLRTSSPPAVKLETELVRPPSGGGSLEWNEARKKERKFNWHQTRFSAAGWQAGGAAGLACGSWRRRMRKRRRSSNIHTVALLGDGGQRGDRDPAEEEAGASEEQPLVVEGKR